MPPFEIIVSKKHKIHTRVLEKYKVTGKIRYSILFKI